MFILNAETELTNELILKLIEKKKTNNARLDKLRNYYDNKGEILNKTVADSSKPNNIVANGYGRYIVDTLASLFDKITYDTIEAPEVGPLLDFNDAESVDSMNYRNLGLYGEAVELHYVDEEGNPRFGYVDPRDIIICLGNTIKRDNILYAIHTIKNYDYLQDKIFYTIDVYTDNTIFTYDGGENCDSLQLINQTPHYFGMVPVSFATQEFGDFEQVISLIDAYDQLSSEALDDYSYFVDSYLMLTGMTAEPEDIAAMKANRVILLDDPECKAEWLIKSENDTVVRNLKNDIKDNIHKFAFLPDFTDEKFGNAESGVSLKYKLFGCEAVLNAKEKAIAFLVRRRLELMCAILNIKGSNSDFNGIPFEQHRNTPENLTELADVAMKLSNLVSEETLLHMLPVVDDVEEEKQRLEEERAAMKEETPFMM